jgi:integrase
MLATIRALKDAAQDRQPIPGKTPEGRLSRDHVFVTGANTPWRNNLLRAFYTYCKRAGIEDARQNGAVDIHSLRVTFTTPSLEHGAPPKAVQAILGHSTLALTMGVYAKATEKSKREAVSALPFATASAPKHVLAIDPERQKTA